MKITVVLTLLIIQGILTSCSTAAKSSLPDININEVKELLSKELTIIELGKRLGEVHIPVEMRNYGFLFYTANGKNLIFYYKGKYIVGAKYGNESIEGIQPATLLQLKITTKQLENVKDTRMFKFEYSLNKTVFKSFDKFIIHLNQLPKDSMIEYWQSCMLSYKNEGRLRYKKIKELEKLCKQNDVILILHPSG
ncbi:MAG: hypothetical protein HRT88_16595 [Lentisphaeraceae bacterium]|nr:hypothetical protein [Lentisphaeraceae bacterium]